GLYASVGIDTHAGASAAHYHYMGTAMLACAAAVAASSVSLPMARRARDAVALATIGGIGVALATGGWTFDHHDESRRETADVLDRIDAAARGGAPGTFVFVPNGPFQHAGALVTRTQFPGWAALYAIFRDDDRIDG